MNRRIATLIALILCTLNPCTAQTSENVSQAAERMAQVMYLINHYYIDTVGFTKIADAAITAAMEELDPHSAFICASDVEATNEPLQGEFEGIGVQFAIIHDTLTVQEPVAGGPSQRVGIRTGDKIITVDGKNIAGIGLTNTDVFHYLRGPKGTKVELSIARREEKEPLYFTVTRDKIPLNSLDAAYQMDNGILMLKLSRFAAKSNEEILTAVSKCKNPIKGVILDLRDNGGGILPTAIEISNQFLEKGDLIVYAEGRKVREFKEFATGTGTLKNVPLVILIDENSASASEIVSGAIQDNDRGIIIGRRSFGKGLVQQQMQLSDGSQLRLTIARYHTPSGRVIQSPYEEGHKDDYYKNFYMRYLHGENFSADSIRMPDSLRFKTLKKQRTVYGGGGIMPDIFIPQDTTGHTAMYSQILRKGLVLDYMNDMEDRYRDVWQKKYGKSFELFCQKFDSDGIIFDGLISLAKNRDIKTTPEEIETSRKLLTQYMKALAASAVFGREAFYKVIYDDTAEMETAIDVILKGAVVE
ncbi:MAG: S41 family peptidase [Alistipes sp.]|nr:S41 family peptidase [Candidatus Minthomonas equi]